MLETVQCNNANPLTDKDALWAIKTIKEYLPQAIETPDNIKGLNKEVGITQSLKDLKVQAKTLKL